MDLDDIQLSTVAAFDDLVRRTKVLTEDSEQAFLKFALGQDECRRKWLEAENECKRLQEALSNANTVIHDKEQRIKHNVSLLQDQLRYCRRVEQEKEALDLKFHQLKELLFSEDKHFLNNETRERTLAFFSSPKRPSQCYNESSDRMKTIRETDLTGSVLSVSELSFDQSEDDLDNTRNRRSGKCRKRQSSGGPNGMSSNKRSCADNKNDRLSKSIEVVTGDHMVAKTTVIVPKDGPITASSVIETKSSKPVEQSHDDDSEDSFLSAVQSKTPAPVAPYTPKTPASTAVSSPALRSLNSGSTLYNRPHAFIKKVIMKMETCSLCTERMRFGRHALKCRDCHALIHETCKEQMPVPCIPTTNTPTRKGVQGKIADFTPPTAPMVPALVVHCINEIENRGLSEVGIYRVPGTEKAVKELKERFLRGKGAPNLKEVDIHVICGCLKDFLRSLREPIVTYTQWGRFVKAAETSDPTDSVADMLQALNELPQPNRDTLAYVILHLQKVAQSPDCKMPVVNLARVFGPTLIGHSKPDPEPILILKEVQQQQMVMTKLLEIAEDILKKYAQPANAYQLYTESTPIRNSSRMLRTPSSYRNENVVTPLSVRRQQKPYFDILRPK